MASLKEIKGRISSVLSTQQITKAMKMVAASKLRKSQERIQHMRPFFEKLTTVLHNLSSSSENEQSWYNRTSEAQRILLIPITSDRGLCGSFNINVAKSVMQLIEKKYSVQHKNGQVFILPLGKKGLDFFSKRNFPLIEDYWQIFQHLNYTEASTIADYVMDAFAKEVYDKVEIVYNEFRNVSTQILRVEQYLPILPAPAPSEAKSKSIDYIYQPSQAEIIEGLLPKALKTHLFKALVDSNASENGARMMAMEKASDNAAELLKDLRLTYNRTRQAAITKEILEIVSGAEALKEND